MPKNCHVLFIEIYGKMFRTTKSFKKELPGEQKKSGYPSEKEVLLPL